jgi:serine/threonine protein kinase
MPQPEDVRQPAKRYGDFEIVREIGRGGMGVVYEAVQKSLGRRVALKVLEPGLGLTGKAVDRFRREAAAAAKLHHTNIVPVYATGEDRGAHYYAMELIDGASLDAVIRQLRTKTSPAAPPSLPADLTTTHAYTPPDPLTATPGSTTSSGSASGRFDRIAAMVADVAEALHHAHQNGVLHRDIKPSNLLLSSDGRLSVTDFGLARLLEQPGVTGTGEFVGTPAYMSPEQITAGRVPVDHRTDLYSLGATLYELMTLQPPFVAEGRDRLLAMVIQKEPAAPRTLNPDVPRDLQTICLKCLEKDPDRRYAGAKDLADDLRRYVSRFAILARRTGPLGKLRKWMRRNPALSALAACLLVAVLAAGLFAWQARAAEERRLAEKQQQDAVLQAERRDAALEKALQLALAGDHTGAERALGDAELLGAAAGDVRFLRGQVAFCRGEFATAIEHLEVAVKLQPERAAPRALLAAAYSDFGDFNRYYGLLPGLSTLPLVSYEDYLFAGMVESFEKPERGLAAMDEAIRRRDSSVARALRSRARLLHAMGTGSLPDAELAIEDARIARSMLPGDPFALAQNVMAHIVAAGIHAEQGRTLEQRQALDQAARSVRELEAHREVPVAGVARRFYFCETGDHTAALAEARFRSQSGVRLSALDEMALAVELYHHGDFQEALAVFDRGIARGGETYLFQILRCYVLAELPGGPARCRAELPAVKADSVFSIYIPTIWQLLGQPGEATAAYRPLLENNALSYTNPAWIQSLLGFNTGQKTASEMLATAGTSRLKRCEGHFFVGMSRLADGDRDGAREHFRRSVDTHVVWYVDHTWSRAFLARLEADPNWPPWIPRRKK